MNETNDVKKRMRDLLDLVMELIHAESGFLLVSCWSSSGPGWKRGWEHPEYRTQKERVRLIQLSVLR